MSGRETLDSLGQLYREKGCNSDSELPNTPLIVHADRDRLTQVMINLLSNAVKFVPNDTGVVRVKVSANEQHVQVEVIDNGRALTEGVQQCHF